MIKELKGSVNNQIPESILQDYLMLKALEKKKSDKYIAIAELSIHSKIVQSDLSILNLNYKEANSEMERKFYSRMSATIAFEYFSDVNFLLGNKLTKELRRNGFDSLAEKAKSLNREFSEFKKTNISLFKLIRNETGAHKTKNTEKLVKSIFEIDDKKVMDVIADLAIINNKLFALSTEVYRSISEFHKENGTL